MRKRRNGYYGTKAFLSKLNKMKKKFPYRKGESNGHVKLKEWQVRSIRSFKRMTKFHAWSISRKYGIHPSYVYHLRSKKLNKWNHLK